MKRSNQHNIIRSKTNLVGNWQCTLATLWLLLDDGAECQLTLQAAATEGVLEVCMPTFNADMLDKHFGVVVER
jgi:hypothetical protein